MASGDTLFVFNAPDFGGQPSSNYATHDTIAAATGFRPVLDFVGNGGSADEVAIAESAWPSQYAGSGVDVVVHYSTDGTATTAVQWQVALEVIQDTDDQDAGGQDFGTATSIADTPSTATANILDVTAAGAISHANAGSPAVGDAMRFKILRTYNHSANTDDAQLSKVVITET